jgi:hypothetical protein
MPVFYRNVYTAILAAGALDENASSTTSGAVYEVGSIYSNVYAVAKANDDAMTFLQRVPWLLSNHSMIP